jgi:hypothetical protein
VALAAPYLARFIFPAGFAPRRLLAVCLILPLSNLIVVAAMLRAAQRQDPAFFLTPDSAAAVDWLGAHASAGDTVLAPLEISRWIPGLTGLRVVYGHPMETPNALAALADADAFYAGGSAARAEVVARQRIRWWLEPPDGEGCLATPGGREAFADAAWRICEFSPR